MTGSALTHFRKNNGSINATKTALAKKSTRKVVGLKTIDRHSPLTLKRTHSNASTRSISSVITSTTRTTFTRIVSKRLFSPISSAKTKNYVTSSPTITRLQETRSDENSSRYKRKADRWDEIQDDRTMSTNSASEDDDTSNASFSSSSHYHGVVLAPIPQRLSASSPPLTLFDNMDSNIKTFLHWKRPMSSSAPPLPKIRAPYMSKKQKANLSLSLQCHGSNNKRNKSSNLNFPMNGSAWDCTSTAGRYFLPVESTARKNRSINRDNSKTKYQMDLDEKSASSQRSDVVNFHPFISPAFKFVPIGQGEDSDCDDVSFCSQDYDICKEDMDDSSCYSSTSSKAPNLTSVLDEFYATSDLENDAEIVTAESYEKTMDLTAEDNRNQLDSIMVLYPSLEHDAEMTSFELDNKDRIGSFSKNNLSSLSLGNNSTATTSMTSTAIFSQESQEESIGPSMKSNSIQAARKQQQMTGSLLVQQEGALHPQRNESAGSFQWLMPIMHLASICTIDCGHLLKTPNPCKELM